MEAVKKQTKNPITTLIVGLVVGTLFGLVVFGWWLFPVQWSDASPSDLRPDAQVEYLRTCIDAFGYNGDVARAQACYNSLGEGASQALSTIVQNPGNQDPKLIAAFATIALQGATGPAPTLEGGTPALTPVVSTAEASGETTAVAAETEGEKSGGGSRTLLTGLCLLLLLAVFILLAVFYFRSRRAKTASAPAEGPEQEQTPVNQAPLSQAPVDYAPVGEQTQITRSMVSYQLGDDMFDEIYPIEFEGDFLGEYGVAFGDWVGVGGPKKVTAFEVWLFDKKNVPTTTQVLMSSQTFNDLGKRQRLEAKGEPVLVEPGLETVLQTPAMRLVARVVDMQYGQGALPAETYFERFVLELAVYKLS